MVKIFLKLLLAYLVLLTGILLIEYKILDSRLSSELNLKNESALYAIEQHIATVYNEIISDAQFIANQSEFVLRNDAINSNDFLAQTYIQFASSKKYFDQIRFIDTKGKEQIRVNLNKQKATIVAKNDLSDKSNRYYFEHTMRLRKGDVYISPLDLNMENGKLEYPIKPTIRICIPIFNGNNKRSGIVVVNYLADQFLNQIRELNDKIVGNIILLNKWGYYIVGLTKVKEWGYMFESRSQSKFDRDYRFENFEIISNRMGFLESENGKFNYRTFSFTKPNYYSLFYFRDEFDLNSGIKQISEKSYEYKIVAYCSKEEYIALLLNSMMQFFKVLLYSVLPTIILLWFFAKYIHLKRLGDIKLEIKSKKIRQSVKELESKNQLLYYKNNEVQENVNKVTELNEKLKNIKTELKVKDKQYNSLSKVNEEFYQMISKDLKGRFDSLFGISKLFPDNRGTEKLEKKETLVSILRKSAENANLLLNRMAIWSKEEISALPYNPEPFDLKILVDDFVLLHAEEAEKKGVELQSFIGKTTFVLADISMICIVLKKLISNAILYSAKQSKVTLSVDRIKKPGFIDIRIKLSQVLKTTVGPDEHMNEVPNNSNNLNFFICNELIKKHSTEIEVRNNSITGKRYSFMLKEWHPEQN